MNVQQIRYFSKVYETGSYARAAEQLYISRQALRKAVHGLEQELGSPLFLVAENAIHPTKEAFEFYQASRQAVHSFEELEQRVAELKTGRTQSFRLGMSCGADEVFAPSERSQFTQSLPGTAEINSRLTTIEGTCDQVRSMVLSGKVDYGNLITYEMSDARFDYEVARSGKLYLAVHKTSPLARRDSVSVADLRGVRFATQGEGFDIHRLIANEAKRLGFELDVSFVGGSNLDMFKHVESGWSVCYAYRAEVSRRMAPNVVCIPFEEPYLVWRYCTLARKGMGDSYLLRYFSGKEVAWSFGGEA